MGRFAAQLAIRPCALDDSGAPVVARSQFPNNVIPSTRLDRAGVAMSKLWAPPNTQGRQYTNVNNFTTNASSGADSLQLSYRTDINVSDKQRMFLRYTLWKAASLEIDPYGTNAYPIGGTQGTPEDFTTQQVVFSDTYSITPTMIADCPGFLGCASATIASRAASARTCRISAGRLS